MKKIIITTITFFTLISCKAQVLPLYNSNDNFNTDGAYYKDIDGDLTKLVGTWKYTNGSEVFKIILHFKEHDLTNLGSRDISYYEDELYGEYQYINSNGTEIINSLNNINAYTNIFEHLIFGNYIKPSTGLPECNDCDPDEKRVLVMIDDPQRSYFNYDMIIRHVPENTATGTTEKIRVIIKRTDMAFVPDGQPSDDRLPFTEFVLEKQ